MDGTLTNTGSLVLGAGATLLLESGGDSLGANISAASGTLVIQGLTPLTATAAQLGDFGSIEISYGALTTSTSGTIATLSFGQTGTLSVATGIDLTLSGALQLGESAAPYGYPSIIDGPGTLTTNGTTTISSPGENDAQAVLGGNLTWINAGTVNDAGVVLLGVSSTDTVTIINKAGATFNLTGAYGTVEAQYNGVSASFTNAGTLTSNAGTGNSNYVSSNLTNTGLISVASSSYLSLSGAFTNTGSLMLAASGTLDLSGGGSLAGSISGAGTLALGGGAFTITNTALAEAASLAVVNAGTTLTVSASGTAATALAVNGGGNLAIGSGIAVSLSGAPVFGSNGSGVVTGDATVGYLAGPGTLTTTGTTTINDFYNENYGSHEGLDLGDGITWVNGGTVNDTGNVRLNFTSGDTVTIVNKAGGSFDLSTDDASISTYDVYGSYSGTDTFSNAGTLAKTGGTLTSTISALVNNTGLIKVVSGTLDLSGGGSLAGSISGAGTLALGGGAFTITNTALGTVTLANSHVGKAVKGVVSLANSAATGGYSEALDASIGGAGTGFSASGSVTGIAAGASNSIALAVGATASTAGTYSGSAALTLISDGAGIDGLGTTPLAGQTVTIKGAAYAYAVGKAASTTISLGVVHVGRSSAAVTLTNRAAAGSYSEALDAHWGTAGSLVTASGSLSGLAAGASNSTSLAIGLTTSTTSTTGTLSGTALLDLVSDGTGIDGLGTTTLTGQTITVTGIVDNYAVAAFQDGAGPAITGSGTGFAVNLGSVLEGGSALTLSLGALNGATGLADLLTGTLSSAGGTGFTNSGLGTFAGLAAGAGELSQGVTLSTGTAGIFTETILLSSAGTNASSYHGALATETLSVTGTVTLPNGPTTYTLLGGPNTITGVAGGNVFLATGAETLNSHDSLTGGSGSNTLVLSGGGGFDIGAPKVFANIGTIDAAEGQAPVSGGSDTRQTVFLRDGSSETVNVASGTPAQGNTNPEAITIYGAADTSTITLGAGADTLYLSTGMDTVVLGGAANSITAGGGTALLQAIAANAGATIVGNASSVTTLAITTAGTVALNAADTYLSVKLLGASKLSLGALGFITGNGGAGGDTIIAGGTGQTLIGGTGDVLTGYVGGGDTFQGASAALNADTLGNWASGDVIDLTDMNSATVQAPSFANGASNGTLTVSDGTHHASLVFSTTTLALHNFVVAGSDGHGGTLIDWHS